MISTSLDNVSVNILEETFDSSIGMNVVNNTRYLFNAKMLYVDTFFSQEASRYGVHERDLQTRYRFIYKPTKLSQMPETGMYLQIVKTKHYITKSWVDKLPPETYVIKYVTETVPNSGVYDIGATRHDL
jgi:hypothetical protein